MNANNTTDPANNNVNHQVPHTQQVNQQHNQQDNQQPQMQYVMYPPQMAAPADDEIDLKQLFLTIWQGKWLIIVLTALFTIAGIGYALKQPNVYKAEAKLFPAVSEGGGGGLAALAGQFGGLASLAGVNLGGGSADKSVIAMEIMQSRSFVKMFVEKHDLALPIMAAIKWDEANNALVIDDEIYDQVNQTWLLDDDGETLEPTDWQIYKAFKGLISLSQTKDTGLITLAVEHYSPFVAKQWVDWLVQDINALMKATDLQETNSSIEFLQAQLTKTQISDMQTMFYKLIEEQTKTLMLAEVRKEYVFKTLDAAVVPEDKVKPKRALIVVLAGLLGGMLSVAIVLVRGAFRKED
ncbi:Wzz/FepE/Etk N-terminal domain-containing protein [Moritella yayanosii]|uniref:Putative Chain length determinant protein involved in Lipopolysaccharide biosynthesis n=1 Tax=Moritella yayanosii TaxID=69539 RepID=A0A330LTD3_9GAMM|nr:Wzz/FepE/Etk N-terminal domain-containing protein [Moritella yayanosii]SQD80120.1 putative Chain length determinant protein involved in Lipopolysaccharide biosynthesis [Moritella yayanosii]